MGSRTRRKGTSLGIACVAILVSAWLAPGASATVTSQTIGATATPSTQGKTAFGAVSLQFQLDAAYDSYDPPTPMQNGGTFHLDNDFQFDRTGLSQCSPATISGLSTSAAIAACPGSQVGSGSATGQAAGGLSAPGTITAFNGTPSGSDPTLLLHFDFGIFGAADAVGVMTASSKGGDFGTQIAFGSLPTIAETALTHADVTLTNQEPSPGHHYVSARCNDTDKTWNFAGDFTFADASTKQASATQTCSLTQRMLTVDPNVGDGGGTVTGPGINCPGDCSQSYDDGTPVSLSASPGTGQQFNGWSGDCTGTGSCDLTMDANKSVGADFGQLTGNGVMNGIVRQPVSLGNDPIAGAWVWACGENLQHCGSDQTDSSGFYSIGGLPADDYVLGVNPPSGSSLTPIGGVGPFAVDETTPFTHDLRLGEPGVPPPSNTTVSVGPDTRTTLDGIPVVYSDVPFSLATNVCPGAAVTYSITVNGTVIRNSLAMTESPAGSGHYVATVTPVDPASGIGRVAINVDCPTGPDPSPVLFDIYIDPSGTVKDAATGNPIAGATVTLLRSDSPGGPFTVVPNGDAIMSPGNRTNPDTTDSAGHFGWDVIAGYYKVQATKSGCNTAETGVLTIPPPVTDLELALTCPVAVQTPAPLTPAAQPLKKKKKCKKAKKRSAETAKKKCKKKKRT